VTVVHIHRAAFININTTYAIAVVTLIASTFVVTNIVGTCCIKVTVVTSYSTFINVNTNQTGVVEVIVGFKPRVAFTDETSDAVATHCIDITRIRYTFIDVCTVDSVANITNIAEADKTSVVVAAGRFTVTIVSTAWITLIDIETVHAIPIVSGIAFACETAITVRTSCIAMTVM